jgi:hypothetical protein
MEAKKTSLLAKSGNSVDRRPSVFSKTALWIIEAGVPTGPHQKSKQSSDLIQSRVFNLSSCLQEMYRANSKSEIAQHAEWSLLQRTLETLTSDLKRAFSMMDFFLYCIKWFTDVTNPSG